MKQTLREWCLRIWGTFKGRDAEVEEELRFHLQMAEQEALRRGDSPREARLRAGGLAQTSESVRDQIAIRWLHDFFRDARHGARLLAKSPLFTSVAIGSLALGIGGITAIFSTVDAVLIRPLPYAAADRLVMIWLDMSNERRSGFMPTPAEWLEWRRYNTVFTDIALTQPADATLSGDSEPEQVAARKATWNLWSVLGVKPLAGRVSSTFRLTHRRRLHPFG